MRYITESSLLNDIMAFFNLYAYKYLSITETSSLEYHIKYSKRRRIVIFKYVGWFMRLAYIFLPQALVNLWSWSIIAHCRKGASRCAPPRASLNGHLNPARPQDLWPHEVCAHFGTRDGAHWVRQSCHPWARHPCAIRTSWCYPENASGSNLRAFYAWCESDIWSPSTHVFTLQLSLCARCCLHASRFLLRARLFSCLDTQDFMRTVL